MTMALTISQDTFDEAVKENIEEFNLTEEEAVEEAVKQFQAQGVNLSTIIVNMSCSSAAVIAHCIKSLGKLLSQTHLDRDEDISHELSIIKVELDKDLAIRVRAGKEGLYPLLIDCLKKVQDKYILQVLETLTSLTNGYPDLLEQSGLEFMMGFLHDNVDLDLITQNLKWIKNCITSHEKNRASLIEMKIQDRFRRLLQTFKDKPRFIIQVCQVTKKLVSDDDIRVIHGNPHEHARALANEILCSLISFLNDYRDDVCVLRELIPAISSLIVRDEYCIKVYEQNGVHYIMDIMVKHPDDEKINRYCLLVLKGLAGSDYVKESIIQNGAGPLIISAIYRHKISAAVVSTGCVCISALALRSPVNARALVDAGSPDLLVTVMNMYKDNHGILKNGCWAIRNIIARSHEFRSKFAVLGAETLLKESVRKFPKELEYEVRVTLRELGCEIKEDFLCPVDNCGREASKI